MWGKKENIGKLYGVRIFFFTNLSSGWDEENIRKIYWKKYAVEYIYFIF